jgi:hypothetical protein
MATREQLRTLLDDGRSIEQAADELGIPAGRAFMIATGRPADGGDPLDHAPGDPDSPQALVNPRAHNPLTNDAVMSWVRRRAARELKQA